MRNSQDEEEDGSSAAIRAGARRFGSILLRARSAEDLEERIGNVVWNPRYHKFVDYLSSVLADEDFSELSPREGAGFYTNQVGQTWLTMCQRWMRLSKVATESILRLKTNAPTIGPKYLTKKGAALIFDLAAPRFYVKATLSSLRSTVCQFAVIQYILAEDSEALNSWKTELLLKHVCEGLEHYIQLLMTIPGTDVPDGIVQRVEGVTWDALVHEWDEARERLDRSEEEEERPLLADAGPPAPSKS
jgi:hypothetical protein